MSWLSLLELGITTLLNVLGQLKPDTSAADAKVASEISAAMERLQEAHSQAVALDELESLRTKPLW